MVSPTKITCQIALPSNALTGNWSVIVENPDGQTARLANGFTITPSLVLAVPGGIGVSRDLNGDGKYEDVNGNGGADFADLVLYFGQIKWIIANEPLAAFDYNGNGRIDFADVVWLFNHL